MTSTHAAVQATRPTIQQAQHSGEPAELRARVSDLRDAVATQGRTLFERWRPWLRRHGFAPGALNLAHYLALRSRDLRELQSDMMPWGLSSLGRAESRVLPTLEAALRTLSVLCGAACDTPRQPPLRAFFRGQRLLQREAERMFGPAPAARRVRIMVTLPDEAATDYDLVQSLVIRGMNCARINCAHGAPELWAAAIANVRQACAATGLHCRIAMDLSGPRARTGAVNPADGARLFVGDRLLLSERSSDDAGMRQVECLPAGVLAAVEAGAIVCIDEGKLRVRVEERHACGWLARVIAAPAKGRRLEPEKGLNFPGTRLGLGALTHRDLLDLDFVAQNADIVGYSFVQEVDDVARLHDELDRRGGTERRPAVVLKIETARAVQNLPELIVRSAGRRPLAVMIARGDLAVEIGYERLAEIQEELLWLSEAAHVPVIWATQVLERMVKKGTPSRAEITDAAMSVRADCVMLNKGPFLAEGVAILSDVLMRMQAHQSKKSPQLRALRSWASLLE